ncbi:phosphatase YidA, partial [Auricularia subglabra TFB-10046 SS5]
EADPPFHMTRAIPWIIELVPTHINKARAVGELCEELGIDMRHVLAFGDGDNDASMLAAVGHGVAMGNAMPEPKRRAKYVTATHNEGGV